MQHYTTFEDKKTCHSLNAVLLIEPRITQCLMKGEIAALMKARQDFLRQTPTGSSLCQLPCPCVTRFISFFPFSNLLQLLIHGFASGKSLF